MNHVEYKRSKCWLHACEPGRRSPCLFSKDGSRSVQDTELCDIMVREVNALLNCTGSC